MKGRQGGTSRLTSASSSWRAARWSSEPAHPSTSNDVLVKSLYCASPRDDRRRLAYAMCRLKQLLPCADAVTRALHRLPVGRRLRGAVRHLGRGHLPRGERPDDHLWSATSAANAMTVADAHALHCLTDLTGPSRCRPSIKHPQLRDCDPSMNLTVLVSRLPLLQHTSALPW